MTRICRPYICAVGLVAVAAAHPAAAQLLPAGAPGAKLQTCEKIKDLAHQTALAAARTWHNSRWAALPAALPARRGWMTTYLIPPPPPAPLGIASFARAQDLGADKDVPAAPITGFAHIAKLLCATSVPAADGTVVVHFSGLGLRFKEGSDIWSKPMRRPALLHALVISRPAPDAAWTIAEEPEARTSLIPGSKLSVPSAADISTAFVSPGRTATTKPSR